MTKWMQWAVCGVLVMGLAACSGKKGPGFMGRHGQKGAQTAAMQDADDGWHAVTAAPHDLIMHFGFDQSVMSSNDMANLKVQAKYLVAHPNVHVRIEGYTDIRGSREYNIGLGWRRARSVATVLQAMGVSKQQISLHSYGAEKPVALGHNEAAYRQNRRAVLQYED